MPKNKYLPIFTLLFIYLSIVLSFGYFLRSNLLDLSKFSSWTYKSQNQALNSLTAWDSGFFYDLAKNGYSDFTERTPKTEILIPEKTWMKIYMGGGLIGENKFVLPSSTEEKINNLIIVNNTETIPAFLPIFNAYPGITNCNYSGKMGYTQDVESFKESLKNPKSCGDTACDKSFVTYFDLFQYKVTYQESYTLKNKEILLGNRFPEYVTQDNFKDLGCKTVKSENITQEFLASYKQKFTTLAFMPAYPLLVNVLSKLTNDFVVAGAVISLISFLLLLIFIYKISFEVSNNQNTAVTSTLIFSVLPGTFYFFTFQDSALLTLFGVLAFYFFFKEKSFAGIMFFVLAILANLYAILLIIPVLFSFKISKAVKITTLILGGLALISQTYYLYPKTGDIFILLNSRMPWYFGATTFLGGLYNYFQTVSIEKYLELFLSSFFVILAIALSIKNKTWINGVNFGAVFAGIIVLNAGFSGILKYLPLTLIPLVLEPVGFIKNKKIIWILIFLGLVLNLTLFYFWTLSSRFVI